MENLLYKALISHYNAQKDEALAIIETYLTKSVGIGDHSNLLDEIKKWTALLAEADEALCVLEKYFED